MVKLFPNRPIILGHRGASAHAPENTMAAFQHAMDCGADGIEFDVKLTRDDEIIIIHDLTVDRTTNGKGKVRNFTLEQIRSLDAGLHFSEQFRAEKIPILRDVLMMVPPNFIVNIELTNYSSMFDGLASKVAHLVKELDVKEQVIFSSFNPFNLIFTKRILPDVPVALLALPGRAGMINRSNFMRWISPKFINPYYQDIKPEFVAQQQHFKRNIIAWNVNDVEEIIRLFDLKMDGIITDDPQLVRSVLGVE